MKLADWDKLTEFAPPSAGPEDEDPDKGRDNWYPIEDEAKEDVQGQIEKIMGEVEIKDGELRKQLKELL